MWFLGVLLLDYGSAMVEVGFKVQKMDGSGILSAKNGWEWVGAQNGNSHL